MSEDWAQILVEEIRSAAVKRIVGAVKAAVGVVATVASFFPIPGPDADARFAGSLLALADALDVVDTFFLEVMSRTLARMPVPRSWRTRVIRADRAANVLFSALGQAVYDTSQPLDQPAEGLRAALAAKQWKYFIGQAWNLGTGKYSKFILTWIKKLFKLSPLRWVAALATLADWAVKVVVGVVGFFIVAQVLGRYQETIEKTFLSQSHPRKTVRVKIRRRL